jgi:hypothetical protein
VGLVWAGQPQNRTDRWRSIALSALAPLAAVPGVSFWSLQGGDATRQIEAAPFAVVDAGAAERDFADVAALMASLDLVISVDTAGRAPGRRARAAGVDAPAGSTGLALAHGARGHALVPDDAALPPAGAGRLGRRDRAGRARAGRAGGEPMTDQAPFNRMKACRHGTLLFNVNDQYVGRALDLYGEYSEAEVELFRRILRAGDIVVDVGANLGAHTLFFSTAVGPRGARPGLRAAAADLPDPVREHGAQQRHQHGLLLDGPDRRAGRDVGAGPRSAAALQLRGVGLGGHTRGDQINVMRADSFALPRCRLIKIDVEGMELQVLKGATGLLERHHPIVYVENDRPQHADALVRWIHALGYRLYWHRPPLYNPQNFFGNPHNEYPGIVSLNMLCVHPEQEVDVPDLSPVRIA